MAAVGGLLGSLPYLATAGHGVGSAAVSAAQILASCLLFGVTFRYVLAADKGNIQLKSGAVAAFGMVRLFLTPTFTSSTWYDMLRGLQRSKCLRQYVRRCTLPVVCGVLQGDAR